MEEHYDLKKRSGGHIHEKRLDLSAIPLEDEPEEGTAIYRGYSDQAIPEQKLYQFLDSTILPGVRTGLHRHLQHLAHLVRAESAKNHIIAAKKSRKDCWLLPLDALYCITASSSLKASFGEYLANHGKSFTLFFAPQKCS